MSSNALPSVKWRVKWKYGNTPGTTIVTAPTKDHAKEYVIWELQERGNLPIQILETIEKKKDKP